MRTIFFVALAAGLTFGISTSQLQGRTDQEAKPDQMKIQGEWIAEALVNDGKSESADKIKQATFSVESDTYTLRSGKDVSRASFILFPPKKAIDVIFVDDMNKETGRAEGIYEVTDTSLKIIWREKGPRPDRFDSAAGSGARLMVFKRAKK